MAGSRGLFLGLALLLVPAAPVALGAQEQAGDESANRGKAVYDQWCAGCHGVDGAGEGPGADRMLPRPRDFTRAQYQIRTTPSGALPTDEDILHVIDVGMPGTAMPGWEGLLRASDREALVEYVKSLSPFFQSGEAPAPVEIGRAPRADDDVLAEGADLYEQIECWRCHGDAGRGDGASSPTLEDDDGFPIYAADLTENWRFNGGGTVEDIFRRLWTGMDGTPMPTFTDIIDSGMITEEQLWSVAHYVRSLSPEKRPTVREVVVAERLEGEAIPTAPDDERWTTVERFYLPLVAQIVVEPRWFSPRVDGLWVQAVHDGSTLAMRVSWSDPSESPDPEWAEFATLVDEAMGAAAQSGQPGDGAADTAAAGGPAQAGDAPWTPGAPDRLVVQFPQSIPEGRERPYFLQGDTRRPAYLWQWQSDGQAALEQVAGGLGTANAQPAASRQLEAAASHDAGQWRVVLTRSLETADSVADLQFASGTTIPIAFQAWDGDNAEAGNRMAVSSWYFLHLAEPVPAVAYAGPAVAFVLTLLLGLVLVRRARAGERRGEPGGAPERMHPAGAAASE